MNPKATAFSGQFGVGLTIRDYIAIEAMKGLISNPRTMEILAPESPLKDNIFSKVTEIAYIMADTLIVESNKK